MQYKERTIDPYLFRAIVRTTGRIPLIPYDLKKIKTLEIYDRYRRMPSYETISFFHFKEHDFSVLGEMENLHTLRIYILEPPLIIEDFSFLKKCKKIKKLDLAASPRRSISAASGDWFNVYDSPKSVFCAALRMMYSAEDLGILSLTILPIINSPIRYSVYA